MRYTDEELALLADAAFNEVMGGQTGQPLPDTAGQNDSFLGDLVDMTQRGALQGVGGLFSLAEEFTGYGQSGADFFSGWADEQLDTLSPEANEALAKELFTRDAEGNLAAGEGLTDPRALGLNIAQGVGTIAPSMLGGGVGGLAGRALLAKRGVDAAGKAASVGRTAGFAGAGGGMAQGMAGEEAYSAVRSLDRETLYQSQSFLDLWNSDFYDEELSAEDNAERVIEELASDARSTVMRDPELAAVNFGSNLVVGKVFNGLLTGSLGKSRLGNAALSGTSEAAEEFAQEGMSALSVNEALREVDPTVTNDNVLPQALTGAVVGFGVGGPLGLAGRVDAAREKARDDGKDPLDQELDAADAAASAINEAPAVDPIVEAQQAAAQSNQAAADSVFGASPEYSDTQPWRNFDQAEAGERRAAPETQDQRTDEARQRKSERLSGETFAAAIRTLRDVGDTEGAAQLETARGLAQRAGALDKSGKAGMAAKLRQSANKIFVDVMGVEPEPIETKGGLPAEQVRPVDGELLTDTGLATIEQRRGETIDGEAAREYGLTAPEGQKLIGQNADNRLEHDGVIYAGEPDGYRERRDRQSAANRQAIEGAFPPYEPNRIARNLESEAREKDQAALSRMERVDAADYPTPTLEAVRKQGVDDRFADDKYRARIKQLAGELVDGGGINYLTDENDRITGRTKSQNPGWFQENSLGSVKDVRNAVDKALSGGTLGDRQKRTISVMLDAIEGERESYDSAADQAEWESLFDEARFQASMNPDDATPIDAWVSIPDSSLFDDGTNAPLRSVATLWAEALDRGVPQETLEALDASTSTTEELGRGLINVINTGRIDQQAGQGDAEATIVGDNRGSGEVQGAPETAPAAGAQPAEVSLRGRKIDNEWVEFSESSGSLNVPRDQMPQVKAEHRGALANFLKARGIAGAEKTVSAESLKPTQLEFSESKVQKAKDFEGGDRAILVSVDGHVVDGHHQWLAKRDTGEPVRVIELDAPIRELLAQVSEFPSADQSSPAALQKQESPVEKGVNAQQAAPLTPQPGTDSSGFSVTNQGKRPAEYSATLPASLDRKKAEVITWAAHTMNSLLPVGVETDAAGFADAIEKSNPSPKARKAAGALREIAGTDNNFNLDTQTEEDLQGKAEREADASIETKAQVDREREHFTLDGQTQDNAPDPVQSAGDLLAESNKSKTTAAKGDSPSAKIEDFGETLEGARKHTATKLGATLSDETIDVAAEPLSKSFPQPNYKKLAEEGVDGKSLALVALLRDQIPNKPRRGWKLKRWAEDVEKKRKLAKEILEQGDKFTRNWRLIDELSEVDILATAEAIKDVPAVDLPKAAKYKVAVSNFSLAEGVKYDPPKALWFIKGPNDRRLSSNMGGIDLVDNEADAVAAAKRIVAKLVASETEARPRSKYTDVGVYRDRQSKEFFIAFKVRSSVIRIKGGFDDIVSAREYVNESRDEIQAKIDAMRKGPNMRGSDNAPRQGSDLRDGDISPEDFSSAFGFRGVQFGNYVEGKRRQADLNRAYDALMDLADAVGVPPKALSMNGYLGLAFGARGRGGAKPAAAHYEPSTVVINLTKNAGPGSLAHEWLHALDNYFARQDDAGDFITRAKKSGGGTRPEVFDAWKGVEKAISGGEFSKRSAEFDKARSKPYWNTTIEKAARAFERYMIDRLGEKGVVNDYLANIDMTGGAYPTAEEMKAGGIRDAFDNLFNVIESKETESGVMLYSRASRVATGATPRGVGKGAAEIEVARFLKQYKGADDVTVKVFRTHEEAHGVPAEFRTKGGYDPETDTLFLYTDSLDSISDLRETLQHEILVHKGLGFVEPKLLTSILDTVRTAAKESPQLAEIVAEVESVEADRPDAIKAEEIIARIAEDKLSLPDKLWNKLVLAIQRALRSLGFNARVSAQRQAKDLIYQIGDAFTEGRRAKKRDMTGLLNSQPEKSQSAYEARIDELFAGTTASRSGLKVLDSSDVLSMLGHGDKPVVVPESKVQKSRFNHKLKAEHWKKIPEWMENPVAVFDSDTVPGRYLFVAPETYNGEPIVMAVEPNVSVKNIEVHLLVSAYERGTRMPVKRWMDDGLLRFIDLKRSPEFSDTSGLRLPRVYRQTRGLSGKVLTERDLVNSRESDTGGFDGFYSRMAEPAPERAAVLEKVGLAPDTRSMADRIKATVKEAWREATEAFIPAAADKFHDLNRISKDAYMRARMSTNTGATLAAALAHATPEWHETGILKAKADSKGLLDILKEVDGETNEWLGWMVGKRAERLSEQDRENLLTDDDIATLLDVTPEQRERFERTARQWSEYNGAMLDLMVGGNLLSADASARFKDDPYYIPFYREIMDETGEIDVAAPFTKRGLSHQKHGIEMLKGGSSNLQDPLKNMLMNVTRAIDASVKNNALLRIVDQVGGNADILTPAGEGNRSGKNVIRVKRGGESEFYRVHDAGILGALTSMGDMESSALTKVLGMPKRLLTAGVTATPTFMIRNAIRDITAAWMQSEDVKYQAGKAMSHFKGALKVDDDLIDLMMAGGAFMGGYRYSNDATSNAQALREQLRAKGMSTEAVDGYMSSLWDGSKRKWEWYREKGERFENMSRLKLFKDAKDDGRDYFEAAYRAKDLMDFSLHGRNQIMHFLVQTVPFMNARIQGLYKLGRVMGNQKNMESLRQMVALRGAMLAAATLALYGMNEDDERYQELPEWDKDANWHFFFGDEHIRIPRPFELGLIFSTLPERTARLANGDDDGRAFFRSLATNLTETLSMNPIPQAAMPMLEASLNYDTFRRRSIDNLSDQGNLPEARYSNYTSELAKGMGSALAAMGLEGDMASPKRIDHIIKGYTGSMGIALLNGADGVIHMLNGKTMPAMNERDYPVVGWFSRGNDPAGTKYSEEFYTLLSRANKAYRTYRDPMSDSEYREDILEEYGPELRARKMLGSTSRRLNQVRKQIDAVYQDNTISRGQKRERINRLQSMMNEMQRRAVEATERARG